jgi:hypothetical protein
MLCGYILKGSAKAARLDLTKLQKKMTKTNNVSSQKLHAAQVQCANACYQLEQKDKECATALWSLTLVHKQGGAIVGAHDKLLTSHKEQQRLQIGNLQKQLQELKIVSKRLHTQIWKLQRPEKRKVLPLQHSRLPPAVQLVLDRVELDAVIALEDAAEYKEQNRKLKVENFVLLTKLSLSSERLATALEEMKGRDNYCTDWVNVMGTKGRKYDFMVKELGIQLMASEMSASQAVYCVTVFMMKTYPNLAPGVDYRVPSESSFKEWGEVSTIYLLQHIAR